MNMDHPHFLKWKAGLKDMLLVRFVGGQIIGGWVEKVIA